MKSFILMIQFLTSIPLPIQLDVDESDFTKGLKYYPLVGLILGGILYGLNAIFLIAFPKSLHGILLMVSMVLLTGGLHLDGLSDTFDGVFSNRPKERILEIMKDSRIGSNGALVMFITLLLKAALLSEVSAYPIALVFMPVFARFNMVYSCRISVYAREKGMGNFFIGKEKSNNLTLVISALITFVIALIDVNSIVVLLVMMIFTTLYVKFITSRIDGMTGDTLGALCELGELVYLIVAAIIFI